MLPNFLLVGANKAGTSALHRFLDTHPDIYMSSVKEPTYFALDGPPAGQTPDGSFTTDMVWERSAYERLFDDVAGEQVVGEASTAYLASARAARRIREEIPEAKVLAVLRNPVDRARSAHTMYVANGFESLALLPAVRAELDGCSWRKYVRLGMYADSVALYRDLFGERFRVELYDDFVSDTGAAVRATYEWLDVDADFVVDTSKKHNVWSKPGGRAGRAARRILGRTRDERQIRPRVRREIAEVFEDDIRRLEALLDRDLSAWRCG